MENGVNIKDMRPVTNCGKTVAFFSVEWPGKMTINDCKLIEGKNGLFAGMPQKEFTLDGQKKYKNIVKLEKESQKTINTAAIEEYRRLTGAAAPEPDYSDIPF